MNLSLLQGLAGSAPGAGSANAAAQKADALASAPGAFRALVDVLAAGAGRARDGAPADESGGAPSGDAAANLPDGNLTPGDSSDAATNSTAASVLAAITAAWTGAPPSDEAGAHGKDARSHEEPSADTVVPAFIADVLNPIVKAAAAAAQGRAKAQHGAGEGSGQDEAITAGLQQAATAADEHAIGLADRTARGGDESPEFDGTEKSPIGLSAQDLAALARARASEQASTNATPSGAAPAADAGNLSSRATNLANFVKAATSTHAETPLGSVTPSVLAPHVVSFSSAASFSSLMTGLSTSAPTSNANALPDSTAAQIVQTLRLTAMGSGGEARITLEPTVFGELKVSVRVEHGQVLARMESDSPVVREWLQSNQGLLRQQLAEQNLTLDRLEVREPHESESEPHDRRGTGHGRASDDGRQPRQPKRDDAGERFEVVA